ncbi:MAG: S8 family serine peptidase [Nitrososphaerota archaeon]
MKKPTFDVVCIILMIMLLNTIVTVCSASDAGETLNDSKTAPSFRRQFASYNFQWSFENLEKWKPYAKVDENSVELILGLDAECSDVINLLKRTVTMYGGRFVRTITTKEKPLAALVKIPVEQLQVFVGEVNRIGLFTYVEPNFKVELLLTPNDPLWSNQWGPKKIQADLAWDKQLGNRSIIVAVIDTGVDYTHEDLINNYISGGYDWVNNEDDPWDDHGHGTHCAGIIAASINNGKGIAGLAQVKIMAEKVLTGGGWGYWDWVASGIIHATDHGAKVISMSLGGYYPSALVRDAIKYALDSGVLVVAAAGNDDTNNKCYPAAFDGVVAVSATDVNDQKAWFSNWGDWIDLAAPGVNIISCVPGGYKSWSGTSMACPHVSGVAALAWSQFPNKPMQWIREWLKYTADDLGQPGFDVYYGYGRVNARKAVAMLPPQHDIIVLDVSPTKFLSINQSGYVKASIMNFGEQTEYNLEMRFYINGTLKETRYVPTLVNGETIEVTFETGPLNKGIYNMTVSVTPVQGETRTNNNALSARTVVDTIIKVPEHFEKIQEAVDAARPGDTIFVSKGNYKENVYIFTDNITLYGEDWQTIINGAFLIYANGIRINNFNFAWGGSGFYGVNNCVIENCYISGSPTIVVINSQNIVVRNNILKGSLWNVFLRNASNTIVENNTVSESAFGIIINGYGTNYVTNNQLVNNFFSVYFGYWPEFFAEGNNVLRNNRIYGYFKSMNSSAGMFVYGTKLSHFIHDIDTSNSINGKPVYYLVSQSNIKISASTHQGVGLLALVNCSNIVVEKVVIANSSCSMLSAYSRDSTISNLASSDTAYGLWLIKSSNISLTSCRITESLSFGAYINGSTGITFRNNSFACLSFNFGVYGETLQHFIHDIDTSNTINGLPIYYIVNSQGINIPAKASYVAIINSSKITVKGLNIQRNSQGVLLVNTYDSLIENSKFYENTYGIQLINSHNNIVRGNHIHGCTYGIHLEQSNNNSIYLNNFINYYNGKIEINSTNIWHGRWGVSGNFWQKYAGEDANGDGIGDTNLPHEGVDSHPLMAPHLPGDVNYDGRVNDSDIGILQAAYGGTPNSANWNPHADFNEDAKVDIRDIVLAAVNYNKTWAEYWQIGLVPLTIFAKDQYGNALTMMKVWIDGKYVGYTGSTFYVTPDVKHEIYVSPSNSTTVPGDGKYVYTFDHYDVFGARQINNPIEITISVPSLIIAHYNVTYYAELKVLAEDQYGNALTRMKVTIDGAFMGYTGSTFYVLPGQHNIWVQSVYRVYTRWGIIEYTFNCWCDGVVSNPRTLTIEGATSLTALYERTFIPYEPIGPEPI